MNESFEKFAQNLPDDKKAEFFRVLQEAGIQPQDSDLIRLLRALQIYKSYYEEIPVSINKGIEEMRQIEEKMQRLRKEIEDLANNSGQSAVAGERLLEKVIHESSQVGERVKHMQTHVEAAVEKSVELVSLRVKETLDEVVNKSIPLEALSAAGMDITEAVAESRRATASMRNDVRVIRVTHVFSCLVASLVLIFIFWGCLFYQFEQKEAEIRNAVSAEIKVNQDILSTLVKTRHNFELVTDTNNPRRKLLFIKNAKGWTTLDKYGVIEFME